MRGRRSRRVELLEHRAVHSQEPFLGKRVTVSEERSNNTARRLSRSFEIDLRQRRSPQSATGNLTPFLRGGDVAKESRLILP